MSLVYLASPYSHPDPAVREMRYVAACRTAALMMQQGDLVYSPIAHSHPIAGLMKPELVMDHEFWMRQCIALLRHCDRLCVLTLDGWGESRGVTAEFHLAQKLGIPIDYIAP